jgi:hypothetical protein
MELKIKAVPNGDLVRGFRSRSPRPRRSSLELAISAEDGGGIIVCTSSPLLNDYNPKFKIVPQILQFYICMCAWQGFVTDFLSIYLLLQACTRNENHLRVHASFIESNNLSKKSRIVIFRVTITENIISNGSKQSSETLLGLLLMYRS